MTLSSKWARAWCLSLLHYDNQTHHTRYYTSLGMISPTNTTLPAHTQQ
jgi:hypothetical protein